MIAGDRLALGIDPMSVLSVADMVECARLAGTRGFAAIWVAEGRRGDVFALLSALSVSTSKIRLGAGVLPVLVRSPWVVAMGAAAVDEISGYRFMLGLGAGHKSVIEDRHGLSYDRPTLRMREVTEIVRRALTGNAVNFDGEIFHLSGAQLSSRPARSDVPVYIAGIGPRVLELAGEIADGAFLIFPTENSLRTWGLLAPIDGSHTRARGYVLAAMPGARHIRGRWQVLRSSDCASKASVLKTAASSLSHACRVSPSFRPAGGTGRRQKRSSICSACRSIAVTRSCHGR